MVQTYIQAKHLYSLDYIEPRLKQTTEKLDSKDNQKLITEGWWGAPTFGDKETAV